MPRRTHVALRPDGTAQVRCPDCKRTSSVRVGQRPRTSTPVRMRVSCPCGRSWAVFLERRAAARYEADILGRASNGDRLELGVVVRNLSRAGLLLELEEDNDGVSIGDRLCIEFTLEHAEPTRVVREIIVRHVSGRSVGGEFVAGAHNTPDERSYDMALALFGLGDNVRRVGG